MRWQSPILRRHTHHQHDLSLFGLIVHVASICPRDEWVCRIAVDCPGLSSANRRTLIAIGLQGRAAIRNSREVLSRLVGESERGMDWVGITKQIEEGLISEFANLDSSTRAMAKKEIDAIFGSPFINPLWLLEQQVLHSSAKGIPDSALLELWSKLIDKSIAAYTRTMFAAAESGSEIAMRLIRETSVTAYFSEKERAAREARAREPQGEKDTENIVMDWTKDMFEVNPYASAEIDANGMRPEDYFNALVRHVVSEIQVDKKTDDSTSGSA